VGEGPPEGERDVESCNAIWPDMMSRRQWLTLAGAVAFVAALVAWLAWPSASGPARPTAGDQIIVFGDSLVQGVGASPGRDLVSVLSSRLGVPMLNAGRNGDTTGAALARLDRAVLAHRPRVVVVLLGGNDLLRRVPRDVMIENLETIVTRIRERGAAVVLATVEIGFFTGADGRAFDALAARTRAAIVPDILGGILGRRDLMADGIHPNDRGYEMMADRLEPVLRDLAGRD
jgi:lysophospholipase L1-like esterase